MKQRAIMSLVLFFGIFTLTGCDKLNSLFSAGKDKNKDKVQPMVVRGTVIAKVGNLPITLEELNKDIDIYNASIDYTNLSDEDKKKAKIDTQAKKMDYLKNVLIRQRIFYLAALDRGIDRKEDIQEILERDKIAVLAAEMQRDITKNLDVSSTEIEEAYKTIKDQIKEPETRRIREIVTKTEDEAKQALIELLQGGDFGSVARSRSIADSKQKDGDLGYIKKGDRGDKYASFDEVAFSPALRLGSLSPVFKGPDGYYIVKIDGIKEGKQPQQSEVWDRIKEIILAGKQKKELDNFYTQMQRNTPQEIYEDKVK